jgi:DNA (cytosine-5)-methyltransferase 1
MSYTYIDLFAGIGGFHLALKKAGMECVFASEIDKYARETYINNHHINENIFNDDIRKISPFEIPDHDILCAGFPCQPFSQAGQKKGFKDGSNSERGNLFFCIADILAEKRPKAFILENVKHLLNHDNGKTFEIIKNTLENLNYIVHYKIIKASDFGKPQHRPRIYIIGFNKDLVCQADYQFPQAIPLEETMSDIWEAPCERQIGFTLRVGGRGSSIDDRRNWDSYRVNGEVKQLTPLQGKRMMGFPDDFILPKSITQAMKQLGNSVCINVVFYLAKSVQYHLDKYSLNFTGDKKMNKGEWSEVYAFFKLLIENKLYFGNEIAEKLNDYVTVIALAHNKGEPVYEIFGSEIIFKNKNNSEIKRLKVSSLISSEKIELFLNEIKNSRKNSFNIPDIEDILTKLDIINVVKGSSTEKGDLQIAFDYPNYPNGLYPIGIKSDLGAKPTLLNASAATNFIYEINGFNGDMDLINSIETKSKIKDRLKEIINSNGKLIFSRCEVKIHQDNLMLVDSKMPEILSEILLSYYLGKGAKISELVIDTQKAARIQSYLKAVLLGMFSSKKWDGYEKSTGSILVKNDGDLRLFHVIKEDILKKYLFNHSKLDTPSSTRHRFGSIYKENNKFFIKLNLQIRML